MNNNLPQKLFDNNNLPHINDGQTELLFLIHEKLKQKAIIQWREVNYIYQNKVQKSNKKACQFWDAKEGYNYRYRDYHEDELKQLVTSWLLRSLGSLIRKGYLTVIPRIDFSEIKQLKQGS